MKYTKKAGQFVCKMAMPLALMFAACSTEGDHVNAQVGDTPTLPRGGAEEETSVVASLENVTVGGRAKRMSPLGGSEDLGEWNGAAGEGSVIRMAELDSVTLDTTGVFYYTECFSSSGDFSFDSVSLNSPYVMFELAPYVEDEYWAWNGEWSFPEYDDWDDRYVITYRVVVDVRETRDVDINAMTYLESARLLNLVKQGYAFAEAKQRADRELLDAFGMYDDSFDYDRSSYIGNRNHVSVVDYVDGKFFEWTELHPASLIANVFGNTGSLSTVDSIREFLAEDVYGLKDSENLSDSSKNTLYNIVAGMYGLGRCNASVEGTGAEVPGTSERYMNIYCLSGQWVVLDGRYKVSEKVPTTIGSLLDSRDGTIYKTVTFDIDGQPQTWMGENLRYSDETIEPIRHFDSNYVAIFQNPGYPEIVASLDSTYWNTVYIYKEPDVIGGDSMNVDGEYFRGICPDGWHIPELKEWSRMLYLMEERTGGCEHRDCTDFVEKEYLGTYASRYLPQVGFGDFTYEAFAYVAQSEGKWYLKGISMTDGNVETMYAWESYGWPYGYVSIRCVKDE